MIGNSGFSAPRRRLDRLGTGSSAGAVAPAAGAPPGFATDLATAAKPVAGRTEGPPSQKACDLARAGGGSAKIQLDVGKGERAEIRVSVRGRMVHVVARVASRAGETAVGRCQDDIARGLASAGLTLQKMTVRRDLRPQNRDGAAERRPGRRQGRNQQQEMES